MPSGPRFELFKSLGINYYGFHVRKNKIYDYLSVGVCSVLIGTTIYLGLWIPNHEVCKLRLQLAPVHDYASLPSCETGSTTFTYAYLLYLSTQFLSARTTLNKLVSQGRITFFHPDQCPWKQKSNPFGAKLNNQCKI
ncbi:hypothetical protein TOT_010000608 [Theileria orientalis strain Shintoku]|uniref:YSIRK Gram-positive signal peptide domain-containing protein n=1 Tax=Theileria orientalis strain Shintoku TaxID=869250 RepID=J4CCC4_THEOR|nr:LOW QUALITY PROTEIN: hypothetical protein TOT_010000608 [Theileria orientalis strain Shintoku]BAM39147.1 hypothetical protein TOT_010000608 [Theileria orientalis strain Shintoku]|eukprot:XP_009689448.1 LOW QUALITY PROTEIN: hypothetical protein TOT_010000608 [Theileria orientalis strain Shintoku]